MRVDLADGLQSLQGHVGQHVGLDTPIHDKQSLKYSCQIIRDNLEKNRFCFIEMSGEWSGVRPKSKSYSDI